ncbi:MAG: hypothetical protein N2644_05345 [Candidatus Sumerlaea chitinivorans]|nr:hypothetical protein [Candidatus Sumerlaea chitinivorans]
MVSVWETCFHWALLFLLCVPPALLLAVPDPVSYFHDAGSAFSHIQKPYRMRQRIEVFEPQKREYLLDAYFLEDSMIFDLKGPDSHIVELADVASSTPAFWIEQPDPIFVFFTHEYHPKKREGKRGIPITWSLFCDLSYTFMVSNTLPPLQPSPSGVRDWEIIPDGAALLKSVFPATSRTDLSSTGGTVLRVTNQDEPPGNEVNFVVD